MMTSSYRKQKNLIACFGLACVPEMVKGIADLLAAGGTATLSSGTPNTKWKDGVYAPDIPGDLAT